MFPPLKSSLCPATQNQRCFQTALSS